VGQRKHQGVFFLFIFISLFSFKLMAWGERGHHIICDVATRLVQNDELSRFLRGRGHLSGHVCNIPDIHWKDLSTNTKLIDASHFMDPENLGYKINEVPLDFGQIAAEKSKTQEQVALELGSMWWRAEQFYRRAVTGLKLAKTADFPDKSHFQDKSNPYNQGIFDFITNLSLMGHYVGDASVPYHNTSDYDGWEKGRGGIHSYYESASVEAMGMSLENMVYEKALHLKRTLGTGKGEDSSSVLETLKELSIQAAHEISKVEDLDQVLSPSDKNSKSYAKRPPAEKGAKAFKDLIHSQLARSSLALAKLWEKAWEEGGAVSFKGYRSYQYPLAPEIVPLDYLSK